MRKVVLFLMILGVCSAVYAQTITVVVENKQDYPHVMGEGSEPAAQPGVAYEILEILGEELGLDLKIIREPWKRALTQTLKDGKADAIVPASYKDKRLEYGLYPQKNGSLDLSRKYSDSTYSFYRLKGSSVDWDGEKATGLTGAIGAPLGYSIVGDLLDMGFTVQESDTESAMKKMIKGRVQMVAALELTGDKLLMTNSALAAKIEKVETPIKQKPVYLMLSRQFVKANPELAEKIWDKIAELRETKLKDIALKY